MSIIRKMSLFVVIPIVHIAHLPVVRYVSLIPRYSNLLITPYRGRHMLDTCSSDAKLEWHIPYQLTFL